MNPGPPRRPDTWAILLTIGAIILIWIMVFYAACGTETGKLWS